MIAPATTNRPALIIVFPAAVILLVIAAAVSLTGCRRPALQPNLPQIYSPPAAPGSGKPPIIFIPGMLGSRLVNRRTAEVVWPDLRVDGEAIALPISAPVLAQNTDDVVATEVVEEAKVSALIPEISVYGPLLEALERYGGYKRASFDAPPPGGDRDTLYLFPYDWRRDVVESARTLGCMIEELKRRLGRPDLRFDLVTHSMGGLVARYYAMYGERDVLDVVVACPDWSGARNLNRVVMIAAPNAGSMNALRVLLKGFSAMSFARPFRALPRSLSRQLPFARVGLRVTFTLPAIYQLLPPRGHARFFSAHLSPLPVDLYDPETWRRFKWSAAFDEASIRQELVRMTARMGLNDAKADSLRRAAEREVFLRVVLRRAAAFHNALAVEAPPPPNLRFSFIGGDCIPTLDGAVIIIGVFPRTIFSAAELPGDKWSRRKAAELIFNPGDGTITRNSLFGRPPDAQPAVSVPTSMRSTHVGTTIFCDSHNGLSHDRMMQDNLLTTLLINR
jgi:pimeloyl-ACP methyl ester carboxylesterase